MLPPPCHMWTSFNGMSLSPPPTTYYFFLHGELLRTRSIDRRRRHTCLSLSSRTAGRHRTLLLQEVRNAWRFNHHVAYSSQIRSYELASSMERMLWDPSRSCRLEAQYW